jgi:hypothetical protein
VSSGVETGFLDARRKNDFQVFLSKLLYSKLQKLKALSKRNMKQSEKVVIEIPVKKLWNAEGEISAIRGRYLSRNEIKELLKSRPPSFVVADVGLKLEWISIKEGFQFWKEEVESHLVEDVNRISLAKYPDQYGYVASEWRSSQVNEPIVLLEKYH